MIKNVLSNLLSKPATRTFPATRREPAQGNRGTVDFDTSECVYCGACALRCPSNAIEVNRQDKEIRFDLFRCIACACCAEACKRGCVQMVAQYHSPVYDKPEKIYQGAPVLESESEEAVAAK